MGVGGSRILKCRKKIHGIVLQFSPCSDHEDELEIRELHRLVTGSIRLPSFLLPLPSPSWIHKAQAMYVVPTVRWLAGSLRLQGGGYATHIVRIFQREEGKGGGRGGGLS